MTQINEPGNPSAMVPTFTLVNEDDEEYSTEPTIEDALVQLELAPNDRIVVRLRLKNRNEQLAELARAWKRYEPTPHNDFADGYATGANDAANELLDWLKHNG